jgi:hypothetical protein
MNTIEVFYQGEQIGRVDHLEIPATAILADVKAVIVSKHHCADALLFLEDGEDAIDEQTPVGKIASATGLKLHVHRCRRIDVTVTFNNDTVERKFAPGTTVARVKRWAAEQKFKMTPEEAGEHVLQIVGTQERPAPSAHIGTLTSHPACRIAFDLVPNERVNGAADEGA